MGKLICILMTIVTMAVMIDAASYATTAVHFQQHFIWHENLSLMEDDDHSDEWFLCPNSSDSSNVRLV